VKPPTVADCFSAPSPRALRPRWPPPRRSSPILGLIAAHKAAWARLLKLEDRTDDYEMLEEAGRAVDAAIDRLTKTPPPTVAGMRAVMEYLVEVDGHMDYLPTLLRSSILRSPLLA
jgi:hypothetical protein